MQNQRFANVPVTTVNQSDLIGFPTGPYSVPIDGTLVKSISDNTVYIIQQGLKSPVSYQVFMQRKFSFSNVNEVSFSEAASWVTGNFLPPVEGTLVKAARNKTVFWVVGQTLHPINYNYFVYSGLNNFPILTVPDADIAGYPQGSAYIK